MKTFLIILILFFVWQFWDFITAARGGASERIRKDEKYKMKNYKMKKRDDED